MNRIITIGNKKGGTGKTTVTVNLAATLGQMNYKVLVIDVDPQCHATLISGMDPYSDQKGIGSLLKGEISVEAAVQTPKHRHYDMIGSYHKDEGYVLYDKLEKDYSNIFAKLQLYDFILMDTPPSREDLLFFTLKYSKELMIPVPLQFLAMEGLAEIIGLCYRIQRTINPDLTLSAIIPTMVDSMGSHAARVRKELQENFVASIIKKGIRKDHHVSDATWMQKPLVDMKQYTKASKDFFKLAMEIL